MQSLITYSHRPGGFGTDPPAVAFSHCHIKSKQDRWQCPGISWGCECLRKGRAARDGQNKTFQTQTSIYWCTASVTLILLDVIKNVSLGREGKAAWNQSHLVLIKTRLGALIHILSCEFNYFPDNKQKQITLFCLFCLQTWQNKAYKQLLLQRPKKKKNAACCCTLCEKWLHHAKQSHYWQTKVSRALPLVFLVGSVCWDAVNQIRTPSREVDAGRQAFAE